MFEIFCSASDIHELKILKSYVEAEQMPEIRQKPVTVSSGKEIVFAAVHEQ